MVAYVGITTAAPYIFRKKLTGSNEIQLKKKKPKHYGWLREDCGWNKKKTNSRGALILRIIFFVSLLINTQTILNKIIH